MCIMRMEGELFIRLSHILADMRGGQMLFSTGSTTDPPYSLSNTINMQLKEENCMNLVK